MVANVADNHMFAQGIAETNAVPNLKLSFVNQRFMFTLFTKSSRSQILGESKC